MVGAPASFHRNGSMTSGMTLRIEKARQRELTGLVIETQPAFAGPARKGLSAPLFWHVTRSLSRAVCAMCTFSAATTHGRQVAA
jgi:hypothetical protein